ncbi:hypothetical protein CISIN_1g037506mg [Citrus sinensis]|uniref:NmrA-like domain-containing protein n=1 Tax=Citrus sinensis TaxID=2711 RepID=A0A067D556_CITSI|nr:hypothetical protein CISIN_1g037506mg [Citrus sinensis]
MEGKNTKPKKLIFGGTGYLGKYMVKASVSSGHNTFVYARPVTQNSRPSKLEIHKEFQGIGVTIIENLCDVGQVTSSQRMRSGRSLGHHLIN